MSRTDYSDQLINRQIANEFRKLDSLHTEEEDKPAIIERISALRAMLNDPGEPEPEPTVPSLRQILFNAVEAYKDRQRT